MIAPPLFFVSDAPPAHVAAENGPQRPTASWAPNTPQGAWPSLALPVTFVLGSSPSRDVTRADAAAELDVALRTWSDAAQSAFAARFGGESAIAAGVDDGANVILFHDTDWPLSLEPGAVAQTVVTVDASGRLRDADIHLNSRDFRFSLDGRAGTLDLRSVLVHEIGHALGLGHSADPRATMFAAGSGLRWRSLEEDDLDGLRALYPAPTKAASTCDAVPCPAGFFCVAGACQRRGERTNVCAPCARVPGACEAAGDDARCIDVGTGQGRGRVCGRACATSADCGRGFSCRATSEAGDLQCVADDECRSAASPCEVDADCGDAACRGGSCKGPSPEVGGDAAADAATDAGAAQSAPTAGGADCGCHALADARSSRSAAAALLVFGLAALGARRRWPSRRRPLE